MVRQTIVLFICYFPMFLGGLVKANDLVAREVNIRKHNVKVLKKNSNSEIDLLKDTKSHIENQKSKDDVCDRISLRFNGRYHKSNMFDEHEDQSTSFKKIIARRNLSKHCQQGSALDVMSSALSEINAKIDKFETQLKSFESLEQKLKEQQDKFPALSYGKMKILNEIKEKLTQNQLELDNFEKQIPNLKEIIENLGQLSSQKKPRLPKNIILGLAQNQGYNQNCNALVL